jgi:hypothetical protein
MRSFVSAACEADPFTPCRAALSRNRAGCADGVVPVIMDKPSFAVTDGAQVPGSLDLPRPPIDFID